MNAQPLFQTQQFSQVQLVQIDELLALQISNEHADALVALQGAQLLSYTEKGKRPLVWLSEQAEFKRGQPVRGGVPVCWPWFGDLQRNPEAVQAAVASPQAQPAHGLVRSQDWLLESVRENAEGCKLVLRYPTPMGLLPAWSPQAELRLSVLVGKRLKLELTTSNTGRDPIPFTQALHTYFAVSHIDQVAVQGLENSVYIDTLENWENRQQQGDIRANGEVDRIYLDVPQEMKIVDEGWQRSIVIRAQESASAVVWNPWIDKSRRLSQFADDAWQRMLCIETANIMKDMVMLGSGAEHRMSVELWSQ